MQGLFAAIAAFVGILLGYWLRHASVKSERTLTQAEKAQVEQRAAELNLTLAAVRSDLASAQSLAAGRAGFESLCIERERTIGQLTEELARGRAALNTAAETDRIHAARISQLEADLRNERQNLQENVALLDSAKKSLSDQFQALAADILDKKSKDFAETSQKDLGSLLSPLREQIKDFREKVEQAQGDSKSGVTRLETLIGALGSLNQQLTEEARNLSTALRGSAKSQGDWGEFILRDLLEKAGLREGDQYSFQRSFNGIDPETDRSRSLRTDVILYLPGGRSLVIDSKVSLTAYSDCVKADCEDERKAALKQHLGSVRAHILGLAKAGYHRLSGIEAPDFVVMFVPIEPAFLLALQHDENLWAEAYRQGILLVGPTTLLYVIRIVNVLWQQELQSRSVQEIIKRGTMLYDKFVGFAGDLEKVGSSLRAAGQSYEDARRKLTTGSGNLVGQAEKLKSLGIRTNKGMPKSLLDDAEVEEESFALAAVAEEPVASD